MYNTRKHSSVYEISIISTVLQLIHVIDSWTEILDSGGCVDVAYSDFMKAFDKVPHTRLVLKLKLYNIYPLHRNWIGSFLEMENRELL